MEFTSELGINNPYNLTLPTLSEFEISSDAKAKIDSNSIYTFNGSDSLNFSEIVSNLRKKNEENAFFVLEIVLPSILIPILIILIILVCCCYKFKDGTTVFSNVIRYRKSTISPDLEPVFRPVARKVKIKKINISL